MNGYFSLIRFDESAREASNLKIIVNSVEDRPFKVQTLSLEYQITGYVSKGRRSLNDLIEAVTTVFENKSFVYPQKDLSASNTVIDLEELDLIIIKDLADGFSKREIREC